MDISSETDQNEMKQLADTLKTVLRKDEDSTACLVNTTMTESLEKENPKNPLLFTPVISCVLKFLSIEEIKNCRLVSREWGSTGKKALANRAIICFEKYEGRLPKEFQSCFLDSALVFSAFGFCGEITKTKTEDSWTIEELTKFFDQHQKYIKELNLYFEYSGGDEELEKNIDISSWISQSPMIQKDTKHMTRLAIVGDGEMFEIPPFSLIVHIKDLSLPDYCRINIEAGIKIRPIKLQIINATFYQDGKKLDHILINDVVDLGRAKEILLTCENFDDEPEEDPTKYILDMQGNIILDNLNLKGVETVNGKTSQWSIKDFQTDTPYSFHRQMKIKDLTLSCRGESIDLFTLPTSLQNLTLKLENHTPSISCSQPIALEKLEYLQIIEGAPGTDYSFLSHFMNCPQLTHLRLSECPGVQMKPIWMPTTISTLILEGDLIKWVDDDSYWNLDKLVLRFFECKDVKKLCEAKIRVDKVLMRLVWEEEGLVDLLEYRKRFNFGKSFYVGELVYNKKFEDSALTKHVDVQSSFYVFENGEKGRAISKTDFYELIPEYLQCLGDEIDL